MTAVGHCFAMHLWLYKEFHLRRHVTCSVFKQKSLALRRSKQMAFLCCPPLFTRSEQQPDTW